MRPGGGVPVTVGEDQVGDWASAGEGEQAIAKTRRNQNPVQLLERSLRRLSIMLTVLSQLIQ